MTRIYQAILVFCFVLCTYILPSQASETGLINGYVVVKDDGYIFDVSYAKVTIKSSENGIRLETFSDSNGYFEFTDLPAGTYKIKVKKTYCKPSKKTVHLEDGEEKKVTMELEKEGDCFVDWGGDCFIQIINALNSEIFIEFAFEKGSVWQHFWSHEQSPGTCELWGVTSEYNYKVTIKKLPNGPKESEIVEIGRNKTHTIKVTEGYF